MIYSVFGDESYDANRERVFAVAGLLGTELEWDDLADKWVAATKGEEFHAAEWMRDNRHTEYATMVNLLAASNLVGRGATMSLKDYEIIFDNAADNFLPYYICFIEAVPQFAELVSRLIPQGTVKFTFDRNLDVQYNTATLYHHFAHLPEWKYSQLLEDDFSFSTRKDPRIQAADLWAYEVMKHMDNTIVSQDRRPMRLSLQALRKTRRFSFTMLDSGYFEGHKKWALENPRPGNKDYNRWREKLGLIDCMTTRIRYEIVLSEMNRQAKSAEN